MAPPFFLGGSVVSMTWTFEGAIFSDSSSIYSILAFLAFIIAGMEAILGVFNLRSQVMMPGVLNLIVCRPESI